MCVRIILSVLEIRGRGVLGPTFTYCSGNKLTDLPGLKLQGRALFPPLIRKIFQNPTGFSVFGVLSHHGDQKKVRRFTEGGNV